MITLYGSMSRDSHVITLYGSMSRDRKRVGGCEGPAVTCVALFYS